MHTVRALFPAAVALVLTAHSLSAQGLTGQITGAVHDSSSSAVAGAEVVLVNEGTGQSRQTVSDPTGDFVFAQLLAGSYRLRIGAPGFQEARGEEHRPFFLATRGNSPNHS